MSGRRGRWQRRTQKQCKSQCNKDNISSKNWSFSLSKDHFICFFFGFWVIHTMTFDWLGTWHLQTYSTGRVSRHWHCSLGPDSASPHTWSRFRSFRWMGLRVSLALVRIPKEEYRWILPCKQSCNQGTHTCTHTQVQKQKQGTSHLNTVTASKLIKFSNSRGPKNSQSTSSN